MRQLIGCIGRHKKTRCRTGFFYGLRWAQIQTTQGVCQPELHKWQPAGEVTNLTWDLPITYYGLFDPVWCATQNLSLEWRFITRAPTCFLADKCHCYFFTRSAMRLLKGIIKILFVVI